MLQNGTSSDTWQIRQIRRDTEDLEQSQNRIHGVAETECRSFVIPYGSSVCFCLGHSSLKGSPQRTGTLW